MPDGVCMSDGPVSDGPRGPSRPGTVGLTPPAARRGHTLTTRVCVLSQEHCNRSRFYSRAGRLRKRGEDGVDDVMRTGADAEAGSAAVCDGGLDHGTHWHGAVGLLIQPWGQPGVDAEWPAGVRVLMVCVQGAVDAAKEEKQRFDLFTARQQLTGGLQACAVCKAYSFWRLEQPSGPS